MQAAATSATGDTQRRLIEQPFYATLASAQSAALARSYRVLDHSTEEFRISTKATASREATWPRASVLWQPPPVNSTPLKFIFWMHTPKCGSSFTLTLSLYECNGHGPRPVALGGPCAFPSLSSLECQPCVPPSMRQAWRYPFVGIRGIGFHVPLPWVHRGAELSLAPDIGSIVLLIRSPAQLLLSAHAFVRKSRLEGSRMAASEDWGLVGAIRERFENATTPAQLAQIPCIQGCQARMLLGSMCFDLQHCVSDTELPRALRALDVAAFVGLQADWERTVCLFHARFGRPLYHAELSNTRPTSSTRSSAGRYDESLLGPGWSDRADSAVYRCGEARFRLEVNRHSAVVEQCMAAVSAAAASKIPKPNSSTRSSRTVGQRPPTSTRSTAPSVAARVGASHAPPPPPSPSPPSRRPQLAPTPPS